jgi:hypothetical protein
MRAALGPALILLLGASASAGGDPSREKVLAAAREIDRLVEEDLAAHGEKPNPPLDDAGFVRRVFLDILGRIPTERELSDFLESSSSDRREALIDRLLASPASSSPLFNWLADLLRVKSNLQPGLSGEPYIHFLKESLAKNKPWDVLVRELLTASGPARKRGNGATGYYLRDRGMPEDNMSNTVTVFLGTRLECAQCHNHPFDRWTQLQYHEMVAFTGGLRYRDVELAQTPDGRRLRQLDEESRTAGKGPQESRAYNKLINMIRAAQHGISGGGDGVSRLPRDYQYDDAKPGQAVRAKAMFGTSPQTPEKDGRSREAYARWLTSPENPRFTTVIANRLWKRFFGRGVLEPVDNLRDATKAENPALLKHLETTMVALGYDVRQFIRVLANSRTYQREAVAKEPDDEQAFRFPGPLLRRMTAEQIWDSLLTLARDDVDGTLRPPGEAAETVYRDYERLLKLTSEDAKAFIELDLLREKDPARFRELQKKAEADGKPLLLTGRGGPSATSGLVRASELPQPAKPGHLLREFGQSGREQIEASHADSNVPQVLALRNGFVDKVILANSGSPARRAKDVAAVFRIVLSREPSAKEREGCAADVAKRGAAALSDLVWALVNTREFLFVR